MKTVSIHEAKTHLSKLLVEVEQGSEVTICRGTVPVARLAALKPDNNQRPKVGEITSAPVSYAKDCFDPLTDEELKDWGI